jgi:threonine dehydrogenase-like Zn-dependent dehydrogenase
LQQALNAVKKGGAVTITGLLQQIMQVDIMKVVTSEITIRGDYCYTSAEFKASLDLLATGTMQLKPLITHTFPLRNIADAVDVLTEGKRTAYQDSFETITPSQIS